MKSIYGLFFIVLFVIGCSNSRQKEKEKAMAEKADSTLISQARSIFDVIPESAQAVKPSDDLLKLGQMLYYDKRLSRSGNISCNSCHNLSSFGVDNEVTSTGDNGQKGTRNSPTVFNAALHNMQFWDGRAKDVEEQAGMPILNQAEMAIPHEGFLIERLQKVPEYNTLFKTAFAGDKQPVTYDNVQKAIGAFERTLLTPSRFDSFMKGVSEALSDQEKTGLKLFMEYGCTSCHNGVGIGGYTMQKFGLVTDYRTLTHSRYNDEGRKQVTKKDQDKDVFKVQGLRNVEKTAPYFHDGSIASLDSTVKIMGEVQLNRKITDEEAASIVSFLKSLTGDIRPEAKINPFTPPIKKN